MENPAATGGVEFSIQMPGALASDTAAPAAVAADVAGGESQRTESATAVRPAAADDGESQPEKKLNCFVRILATGELAGNALGTLASLWATFVLLGGYRSSLNLVDFWTDTAMVFLEAFRVFIRNFKLDNHSLFGSTKAFRRIHSSFASMLWRPQEGDELVLIVYVIVSAFDPLPVDLELGTLAGSSIQAAVLILLRRTQLTEKLMRLLQGRRPILLWTLLVSPLSGIAVKFWFLRAHPSRPIMLLSRALDILVAKEKTLNYLTQVVALVLLYYRPRRIATLTRGPWGRNLLHVSKVISALLLAILEPVLGIFPGFVLAFSTVVLLFGSLQDPATVLPMYGRCIDMLMHISFLWFLGLPLPIDFGPLDPGVTTIVYIVVLLTGNLQIPATVAQIVLSSWRLAANSHGDDSANMVASIRVFYGLVLCQGSLYIMACILTLISVVPCRSLARCSGFGGEWGARAVDLYYERAYTKRIEIGVFAEDTISLASFVVDAINSSSSSSRELLQLSASNARELQLVGVRVLHSLLQRKDSYSEELIAVFTRSEKAVPTLISMLGWTFKQDRDIRLFAAKATANLAGCPLKKDGKNLASYLRIAGIAGAVRLVSSLLDAENQPPSETGEGNGDDASLGPQPAHGNNEICSCVYLHWQDMKDKWWSIPDDPHLTSQDSLPVLGMMILERLACDPDNCAEIVKDTNLIPKIIGLTSYTSHDESSSNRNALMISSSLNLVSRIATTNGKVGATLRQELWESPFLLGNITCILEDSRSSPEVWKPAIDIIVTLALDVGARHEIGSTQVIIHKLLHIFIIRRPGPINYHQSLRVAAGWALANLALESPENCSAILEDQEGYGYDLVKDLEGMLGSDEYRCVAASLLQNLCECSRMRDDGRLVQTFATCSRIKDWLSNPGVSNQLSSALLVVLQNIEAAGGKQLEALIGLTSQICYVLPSQPFVQGLESHIIGATIVQKLVNTLNSNKQPSHEYPRMRRAIVDMIISVLRHYPGYAIILRREGMVDALSKAEKTPSKVEKYRVFLGKEGVVLEHGLPLRDLVATAKDLIHQQLQHMVLKQAKMHD